MITNNKITTMKKEFKKEKIATYTKFTNEYLEEVKSSTEYMDVEYGLMTIRLSNFIFTRMIGEKTITKTFARPTFFEWLFRKERTVWIDVVAKEIMENPPNTKANIIYKIEEHEESQKNN